MRKNHEKEEERETLTLTLNSFWGWLQWASPLRVYCKGSRRVWGPWERRSGHLKGGKKGGVSCLGANKSILARRAWGRREKVND